MYYVARHFRIEELVDRATFEKFGEQAWQFFNPALLFSLDGVRDYFGKPITVNNWKDGGPFQWRGLRSKACDIGAEYSIHGFGGAADYDVKSVPAEEVRQAIIKNKNYKLFRLINCLETDVPWVHMDTRNILGRIRIVHP